MEVLALTLSLRRVLLLRQRERTYRHDNGEQRKSGEH
jgi:hypothetical protein